MYEDFAQPQIARLGELRLAAEEDRVEALLSLGGHGEAIPALEAMVTAHPFRERPHAQLMVALYRAGRTPHALEVFDSFRGRLVDELGLDPSPVRRPVPQHPPAGARAGGSHSTPTAPDGGAPGASGGPHTTRRSRTRAADPAPGGREPARRSGPDRAHRRGGGHRQDGSRGRSGCDGRRCRSATARRPLSRCGRYAAVLAVDPDLALRRRGDGR